MTMTRNAKAEHQAVIAAAGRRGYTEVRFASPKLIAAARAERGHSYMSRREYIATRMGRRAFEPSMIADRRRQVASVKREQRTLGGRRITGRRPGSKRPIAWSFGAVERCRRARPVGYALAA
jgi:hypothetical protein